MENVVNMLLEAHDNCLKVIKDLPDEMAISVLCTLLDEYSYKIENEKGIKIDWLELRKNVCDEVGECKNGPMFL